MKPTILVVASSQRHESCTLEIHVLLRMMFLNTVMLAVDCAQNITTSYTYTPYGEITQGVDPYELTFAYNAEEYNPVTALTYLRARYYQPSAASFITQDSALGRITSINSQNRYCFAESDPINNADPSGHAIGKSAYERQMEQAGGINEIYNFYVGTTLQNAYSRASSAFYGQLNYAYGVDFHDINAIASIAGISQATANYYINTGATQAKAVGQSWGCSPGALTNAAVNSFAANVNATKNSVNSQIAAVKSNKYGQYNAWQEEVAREAAEAAAIAQAQAALRAQGGAAVGRTYTDYLRNKYGVSILYTDEYVFSHYGNARENLEFTKKHLQPGYSTKQSYIGSPNTGPSPYSSAYVYVVNNENGLGIMGHSAVLFRDPGTNNVNLYSFSPGDNESPFGNGSVANLVYPRTYEQFYADAASGRGVYQSNGVIPSWYEGYTRYLELEVSASSWSNMHTRADYLNQNPPFYYGIGYNCQSFVEDVLATGGVHMVQDYTPALAHVIPNYYYGNSGNLMGAINVREGVFK